MAGEPFKGSVPRLIIICPWCWLSSSSMVNTQIKMQVISHKKAPMQANNSMGAFLVHLALKSADSVRPSCSLGTLPGLPSSSPFKLTEATPALCGYCLGRAFPQNNRPVVALVCRTMVSTLRPGFVQRSCLEFRLKRLSRMAPAPNKVCG